MGWFGKLPSTGDFAGRGMPSPLQETVHKWISSGMARFVQGHPEDWLDAYLVSPVWHFLINAGLWDKPPLMGCIAPSVDKVGRYSPLTVLRAFDKNEIGNMLPPNSRWLYRVDAALRRVIGDHIPVESVSFILEKLLDAEEQDCAGGILNDLGIGNAVAKGYRKDWFSWTALPALFSERDDGSFWWSESSPSLSSRQIIHRGPPDENLFCALMKGGNR
jgi:type VI secretion system protein ImpM